MSFTGWALVVAAVWCAIGLSVSALMRRRGHAFFTWWYLGSVLGPLSVPLAMDAIARERSATKAVAPARVPEGTVAVLVGVDGSEAALAAARAAVVLLGERIGRVSLAAVVDYDAGSAAASTRRADAEAALAVAEATLGAVACERVVLVGAPADVLARTAREGNFDLLVVGSRGRGASRTLLGSVASRLASGAGVPVLVGGTSELAVRGVGAHDAARSRQ